MRMPHIIPYERIVIDSNKIYGPGMFATNQVLVDYGVDEVWKHRLERQVAFSCLGGVFITTDYAIDNLVLPPGYPVKSHTEMAMSTRAHGHDVGGYVHRGGTRCCRSNC